MLTQYTYQPYSPHDVDEVFALDRAHDVHHWSLAHYQSSTTGIVVRDTMQDDNPIIGFVIYSVLDTLEILRICTHTKYRNGGIASALLHQLKSIHTPILLEVRRDNTPAITLYTKEGFVQTSVRKHYYFDSMDAKIMQFC